MFRYTRQVLDETLRVAVVAPWGARFCEHDLQVGEFVIPKEVRFAKGGTPAQCFNI